MEEIEDVENVLITVLHDFDENMDVALPNAVVVLANMVLEQRVELEMLKQAFIGATKNEPEGANKVH